MGESYPPCRVFYHPADADTPPQRKPPADLMPLGGNGGDWQVEWLDPSTDFHSKVEFKYPIRFLPFRDFAFRDDPVGGDLLVESLCAALGPGEPKEKDLFLNRTADAYAKDTDWPFNWLLVTYVVRSMFYRVRNPPPWGKPVSTEVRKVLEGIESDANKWLERCRRFQPLENVGDLVREPFRTWWADADGKYGNMSRQLFVPPSRFPSDLGEAINHTVRHVVTHGESASAPRSYVANLERQNHWTAPSAEDGRSRFFYTAIHQMLGYGSSWQTVPEEHRDDVLLLQVKGDRAFFRWHDNGGCVLHFWIGRDALAKLDFSCIEATLECD